MHGTSARSSSRPPIQNCSWKRASGLECAGICAYAGFLQVFSRRCQRKSARRTSRANETPISNPDSCCRARVRRICHTCRPGAAAGGDGQRNLRRNLRYAALRLRGGQQALLRSEIARDRLGCALSAIRGKDSERAQSGRRIQGRRGFSQRAKDSHTFFVPPSRAVRYDSGYRYALVGNDVFITLVRPNTDAAASCTSETRFWDEWFYRRPKRYQDVQYYFNTLLRKCR